MEAQASSPKVLVVGCGGIGGVVLSKLLESGQPVACVARREEIAEPLRTRGPVLRDEAGERAIRGALEVYVQPPARGSYDFILLTTPPNQVEEAARGVAGLLAPQGALVTLQNGLCEERVAQLMGPEKVIGAIVAWGASSPAPGVYEQTASGGFVLGTLDGRIDERVLALGRLLQPVGRVAYTDNLRGARWSKLAINCAVSTLGTVGGERLGKLLVHQFVRRLALEVFTEAIAVAHAESVNLQKVAGTVDLHWLRLSDDEHRAPPPGTLSLTAKHTLLLLIGARYRRLRSSMLAAIERGREPPVDFLNGEIVVRGRAHGIPAPVNEQLLQAVKAIAAKQERTGLETLRRIYDQTRPAAAR